jgi:hypothetical protein
VRLVGLFIEPMLTIIHFLKPIFSLKLKTGENF